MVAGSALAGPSVARIFVFRRRHILLTLLASDPSVTGAQAPEFPGKPGPWLKKDHNRVIRLVNRPNTLGAHEANNYPFPTMRLLSAAFLALALALTPVLIVALGAASPAAASQNDTRLDKLFDTLQTTTSEHEAQIVEARIWELWFQSGRADIDNLLTLGGEALNRGDFKTALDRYNDVIKEDPEFAEGWNRRATLYFMMGEYEASIADIETTLALEPRHFGALSGLGLVNIRLERIDAAIKAFEAALKVNPRMPGTRQNIRALRGRGQDI